MKFKHRNTQNCRPPCVDTHLNIILMILMHIHNKDSFQRKQWSQNGSTVELFSCPQDGPLSTMSTEEPFWLHFFQCLVLDCLFPGCLSYIWFWNLRSKTWGQKHKRKGLTNQGSNGEIIIMTIRHYCPTEKLLIFQLQWCCKSIWTSCREWNPRYPRYTR